MHISTLTNFGEYIGDIFLVDGEYYLIGHKKFGRRRPFPYKPLLIEAVKKMYRVDLREQ